jgi:hypothetical protein
MTWQRTAEKPGLQTSPRAITADLVAVLVA